MPAARAIALLLAPALVAGAAGGATWRDERAASYVDVRVARVLAPRVAARIPVRDVVVEADDPALPRAVLVTLNAAQLATGDPREDDDLRSPRFFDVRRYPSIRFTGDRVQRLADGRIRIDGTLSLHGAAHPMTFLARVRATSPASDDRCLARYEADGRLSRSAYGMRFAPGIVSDAVVLHAVLLVTSPAPCGEAGATRPSPAGLR